MKEQLDLLGNNLGNQFKQLGDDLLKNAKSFIGIEDEPSAKVDNYTIQTDTFNPAVGAHSDIRSVYQTFRQLTGGADGAAASKPISYKMSNNDFLYCDTFELNSSSFTSKPEIQKIVLNEFQPYDQIFLGQTLQGLLGGILNFAGGVGKALGEAGLRAGLKNKYIQEVARDPAGFYSGYGKYNQVGEYVGAKAEGGKVGKLNSVLGLVQEDPMLRIIRMFTNGFWLNTYELPFYGNTYLEESNAGKWTQEGSKRSWGEGIATALEGFGMYYPTTPNWSLDIANAGRGEINVDFYLINKDEKWMLRNYKFMHALFSGTQFVMLKHSVVQSPNVYNVVVPGRFEIVWASVTMSATMEGKLRKCSYIAEQLNYHYSSQDSNKAAQVPGKNEGETQNAKLRFSVGNEYQALQAIDENTLWPDAWKVSIKIKDLGINCFNNYLNYQMYGATGARLRVNTSEQTQLEVSWGAIKTVFDNMISKLQEKKKGASKEEQEKIDQEIKEVQQREQQARKTYEKTNGAVTDFMENGITNVGK